MDQIKDLLAQLRRQPNRPDLHNTLGRLYQQRGEVGDASKHFLAAARIFSTPDGPSRNLNKAIAILRKMVRDFPSHHDSYYLLAEILDEMDSQGEAIEVYSALSEIYGKEGKHLMAVSVFDKVISSDPDDQEVWIRFATLNRDAGMPFHAAQAFVKAASIGLATRKGELPAGLVLEALRLDPENSEARELLKTLVGRGETGSQQEEDLLALAEEIDRGGQYEPALDLLALLKGTSVQDKAVAMAARIRRYSGMEDSSRDGEITRTPVVSKFAGTKVLVVDDEPEIVLLLEQILESEGFDVFTARDGQEGLDIYLRERPPLVVSDAMLPKLHGFELCARIKEESDYTAKVMILTAVYKKYKYKGKVQAEYYVDEYLDKPFQITEFLQLFHKMAESAVEYRKPDAVEEGKPVQPAADGLTILVGSGMDQEQSAKVTAFCERNSLKPVITHDSRSFFDHLKTDVPDILLIRDDMPGIDASVAAHIIRSYMVMDHMTMVLVAKDRSRLDEPQTRFDHRVAAPIDKNVLDNIVNLHRSGRGRQGKAPVPEEEMNESRMDSLVRSKVARILKSHNQLEEYYSTKVRELEEELRKLKESRGKEVRELEELRKLKENSGKEVRELEEELRKLKENSDVKAASMDESPREPGEPVEKVEPREE